MIVADRLTRAFGSRIAVEDVTLSIGRSEIVALLGPNGAGKTTTLRMLAGLIAPTSGTVTIDGLPVTRANGRFVRQRMGFLTETPGLWDRLSVRENLDVYAGLYSLPDPKGAVTRALDTFELADRASTRAAELSRGMRQKVALARALLHDPIVLLLDEPTSGLDPEITRSVRTLLAERRAAGCSILVSTHNLDEAERMADRVAVLHRRLLVLDDPATLRRRLTSGRARVCVVGDAAPYVDVARRFDPNASVDGARLTVKLQDEEAAIPMLVEALVAAGARIMEVAGDVPALEDVYLHLMRDE